jgi:hypothetical protein
MHYHPHNSGNVQAIDDLLLTTSMDWTCKLWSHKASGSKRAGERAAARKFHAMSCRDE